MMKKMMSIMLALCLICSGSWHIQASTQEEWAMDTAWNNATDEQRMEMPAEYKARACGMTLEEFCFMARVVEAESDRSDNIEGKIAVAVVILNRVDCDSFPDTIEGVLRQSGQFEVVVNGSCSISSTDLSEWAIVEAIRGLDAGLYPRDLVYFNCISFSSWNYDYALIGGNYFSRSGCSCEYCEEV